MLLIAFRNLFQERIKLLISVIGVAFAVILMLTLVGIYNGAISQFTQIVTKNPTDIVVAQKGIRDFFHGASLIPEITLEQIKNESGIKEVVPMIAQRAIVERDGKSYDIFISSFLPDKPQGAPWEIAEGRMPTGPGEVIIAESLAKKLNKNVGDKLDLASQELNIVGLAASASAFGTHYAWVSFDQARVLSRLPLLVNFAYINVTEPDQTADVTRQLQSRYPELAVLTKSEFVANNKAELDESFLPIIQAIVVIGFLIGTVVISLTLYTSIIDKAREYGILKAVGVNNRQLYRVVLVQALVTTLSGLTLGLLLVTLVNKALAPAIDIMPVLRPSNIGAITGSTVFMGLLASFIPIKRIVGIDPAEVFK